MARYLGIAGIQMEVVHGQDNTAEMMERLDRVAASFPWADLVFFSELCVSGMNRELAQPIPNPTVDRFCEWARREEKWLIPGSMYERDGGKIFNTSIVISPEGAIKARYRKLFPWAPLEQSEAGEEFCIFDIPGKGRFGLCICYDQWFPELVRTLAWMGAEAVFNPTATYTSDRSLELVLAQANAISNQVYFLSVNGVGGGGIGQSIFVDPEGRVLQASGQREVIMTEVIDLDLVSRVREYGTLGLSQLWKDLGNFKQRFPVYGEEIRKGRIYESLGPLKLHRKLGD
ncbi:MAG: carbon-nitrogen hydrolase family protein [Deltaproteobacteria bacterium]|nr:carbon-nitrogen hydrolase family protein [Deltaproteobacteria bacterium]